MILIIKSVIGGGHIIRVGKNSFVALERSNKSSSVTDSTKTMYNSDNKNNYLKVAKTASQRRMTNA